MAAKLEGKRFALVCKQMSPMPEHKAIEGSTVLVLPDGAWQRKNLSEVAGRWPKPMCQLMLDGNEKICKVGIRSSQARSVSTTTAHFLKASWMTTTSRSRRPMHKEWLVGVDARVCST